MAPAWLDREVPPWRPELSTFLIRSRLPTLTAVGVGALAFEDLGAVAPWLIGLLVLILFTNAICLRRVRADKELPEIMGFLDITFPLVPVMLIPRLLPVSLLISLASVVMARLTHGPRVTVIGLAVAAAGAAALAVAHPVPGHNFLVAVFVIVGIRAHFAVGAITKREMRVAEQLRDLASNDHLTGLANRRSLATALDRAVACCEGRSLLVIDLDGFKDVNDAFGHHSGDLLLREVGKRLTAVVEREAGSSALVARLGGDEFAVVIDGARMGHAFDVATAIQASLAEPAHIAGVEITAAASIGIASMCGESLDPVELSKNADTAMYFAKQHHLQIVRYDVEMEQPTLERLRLLNDLRVAIDEEQFELAYQPIFRLDDGSLHGLEALIRWNHPVNGLIMPDSFIQLAEITGMMSGITRWVVDRAISDAATWRGLGHECGVSINISMTDLASNALVSNVRAALQRTGLDPAAVTFELTETAAMADPDRTALIVGELSELGSRISIDDFGTGYSSLSYIDMFHVDEVKIDRSFISSIDRPVTSSIVGSILRLSEKLHVDVVAEGIQSRSTSRWLRDRGCTFGQGFLMGRPEPLRSLSFAPLSRSMIPGECSASPTKVAETTK